MSYERSPRLVCSITIGTYMRGSTMPASCQRKYTRGVACRRELSEQVGRWTFEVRRGGYQLLTSNVQRPTEAPGMDCESRLPIPLPARRSDGRSGAYVWRGKL